MKKQTFKLWNSLKYMVLATPFLFFFICSASILCPSCHEEINLNPQLAEGASWRCKRCGKYVYSENADWQGFYYCNSCGTKKGEE